MENIKSFLSKFFKENRFDKSTLGELNLPYLTFEQIVILSYFIFEKLNREKDIIVLVDKDRFNYAFSVLWQLLENSYFSFITDPNSSELAKKNYIDFILNNKENSQIVFIDKEKINDITFPESVDELQLKVGKEYNYNLIQQKLSDFGYQREYKVENVGEYAIRGDIVDVFSINNVAPLRLEFWGDELVSIREIDIFSQKSVKQLEFITIMPFIQQQTVDDLNLTIYDKCINPFFIVESNDSKIVKQDNSRIIIGSGNDDVGLTFIPKIIFSLDGVTPLLKKYSGYKTIFVGSDNRIIQKANEFEFDYVVKGNLPNGFVIDELKTLFISGRSYQKDIIEDVGESTVNKKSLNVDFDSLEYGDIVVHEEYGIGKFLRIETIDVGDFSQDSFVIEYKDGDLLYVSLDDFYKITKYSYDGTVTPNLDKLGSKRWENTKKKIKDKFEKLSKQLILLNAKRAIAKREPIKSDNEIYKEFCDSFEYTLTPDQAKAINDIENDLSSEILMDRLVCGDVGFGKTEVAFRAAVLTVLNGKQVAFIAPTTILAYQHYKNLKDRLQNFPINVEVYTRHTKTKDAKKILKRLLDGDIDILVGTHKIFGKNVRYKDLSLMIIDEEQRFGVSHKNRLLTYRSKIDVLTLSATPIPRTLSMSLGGIKDLSVIMTPPKERLPIETSIVEFSTEAIITAIKKELSRDGQVFVVHNRVNGIYEYANKLQSLLPDVRFVVAHGQMKGTEIEDVIEDFINKKYDVLISTTIIENGIDISDANTIIIDNAQNFGLSQLYQLRGRVGRSYRQGYCYLIVPSKSLLTGDVKNRLVSLTHYTELGSGFNIAMRDLEIRGAGDVLGKEQSGYIMTIGYSLYMRMLNEMVNKLKKKSYISPHQVSVSMPFNLIISQDYIEDVTTRATLYSRLSNISNLDDLNEFVLELKDRFGAMDLSTKRFIEAIKIRILAGLKNINTLNITKHKELIIRWEEYNKEMIDNVMSCLSRVKNRFEVNLESGIAIIFILKNSHNDSNLFEEVKNILETIKI